MSTRDLIDAIESKNSSAIQREFHEAIMSRVAERLDAMRIEVAKNMFSESAELDEAIDNGPRGRVKTDNIRYGQTRNLTGYEAHQYELEQRRKVAQAQVAQAPQRQARASDDRLPRHLDPASDEVQGALERHLGGTFQHYESDPKYRYERLPDGRVAPALDLHVTHSYGAKDYGLSPDEFDDEGVESYKVRLIKHPDHGFIVRHGHGVNESADLHKDRLEQILADHDINSHVEGDTVHVDRDDVKKAQKIVKNYGYDHQVQGGLNEVLSKKAKASEWISDFVHSKDPKFAGKSKEQRIKMALGAYYAKQRDEAAECKGKTIEEEGCETRDDQPKFKLKLKRSTNK